MTDRVIRIIVDTGSGNRDLDALEDNLEDVEDQEKKTEQSTKALSRAFGALLAGLSLRELGQAADAYTNIGNRIRLVTDSQEELNTVQDELFALSQRTRTSLTATAELYSRTAIAVEELGASQRETIKFTEAVNQTLQISGATAAEAAGSTVQFAQGLAAGALRGEELNSVLEGNNRLARVLAKEFGVGVGQLRQLGEQGELTADRIFKAVLDAGPALNAEFQNINPTIEQTITTMGNFATLLVGSFNEAAGVTEGLTRLFTLNEESAAELAATIRSLGLDFREFVEVATVSVVNFAEAAGPRFAAVQAEIVKIIAALTRDEDLFREALAGQDAFKGEIDEITSRLDAEFDAIQRNNEERRKGLEARNADLDAPGTVRTGGETEISKEQQKVLDQQAKLIASLTQQARAVEIANRTGREYKDVLQELRIEALAAAGGTADFGDNALELAGRLQKAREEAELLKAEQRQLEADMERAAEITEESATAAERYAVALAELQDLLDRGLITPETFERAKDGLDDLDSATEDFFRRARENSQDILAELFAGGFDSLEDFGQAFAQMIQRLAAQALAAKIFESLLGSGNAGGGNNGASVASFFSSVFGGRQFGGGVQAGQPVNTGEGGRFNSEVFIPNVGGTVVPINQGRGGGISQPANVNFTAINALEDSEIIGAFQGGAGDQVLINRISVKRTAIRRALGV